jgi:hypothetical protein
LLKKNIDIRIQTAEYFDRLSSNDIIMHVRMIHRISCKVLVTHFNRTCNCTMSWKEKDVQQILREYTRRSIRSVKLYIS